MLIVNSYHKHVRSECAKKTKRNLMHSLFVFVAGRRHQRKWNPGQKSISPTGVEPVTWGWL